MKKGNYIIFFIVFILCIGTTITKADQLSYFTKSNAEKVVDFLNKQDEIILFCGCCDGSTIQVVKLSKVLIAPDGEREGVFQVEIEGINDKMEILDRQWIDIAYVHIKKLGQAVCLGTELGFTCDPCIPPFSWPTTNKTISQNYIYIGTKKYDASHTWTFSNTINQTIDGSTIDLTVGKKNGGGIIMIAMPNFDGGFIGNLMIYLVDGTPIQSIDRGIHDIVDNKSIAAYYLTMDEISKMKKSDIASIRYSINNLIYGKKSFTATNENKTNTSEDIKILFQ